MATGKFSRLRGIGPLLRTITFVVAAITTVLLGAAFAVSQTNADDYYGDGFILAITLPFSLYSVVWCAVALLVLFFRGSYHPGIDIGFDLVGWGANWGWSSIVFISAAFIDYDDYGYNGRHYYEHTRVLKELMYSSAVLMVLYGTTHLALFVMACKATHERRIRKKRGYMIELDDVEPLKDNAANIGATVK